MGTVSGPFKGAYTPTESSRVQSSGIYGEQSFLWNGFLQTLWFTFVSYFPAIYPIYIHLHSVDAAYFMYLEHH